MWNGKRSWRLSERRFQLLGVGGRRCAGEGDSAVPELGLSPVGMAGRQEGGTALGREHSSQHGRSPGTWEAGAVGSRCTRASGHSSIVALSPCAAFHMLSRKMTSSHGSLGWASPDLHSIRGLDVSSRARIPSLPGAGDGRPLPALLRLLAACWRFLLLPSSNSASLCPFRSRLPTSEPCLAPGLRGSQHYARLQEPQRCQPSQTHFCVPATLPCSGPALPLHSTRLAPQQEAVCTCIIPLALVYLSHYDDLCFLTATGPTEAFSCSVPALARRVSWLTLWACCQVGECVSWAEE